MRKLLGAGALIVLMAAVFMAALQWSRRFESGPKDALALALKLPGIQERIAGRKYLLINFWASWCGPCMEETPSLVRFVERHAQDIAFLSISQDANGKEYENFLKAFPSVRAAGLVYRDVDMEFGEAFRVEALPNTFFFRLSDGHVVQVPGSRDWSEPGIYTELLKVIDQP